MSMIFLPSENLLTKMGSSLLCGFRIAASFKEVRLNADTAGGRCCELISVTLLLKI
jgi:hypothetical protein